jgi:hypothetical protein
MTTPRQVLPGVKDGVRGIVELVVAVTREADPPDTVGLPDGTARTRRSMPVADWKSRFGRGEALLFPNPFGDGSFTVGPETWQGLDPVTTKLRVTFRFTPDRRAGAPLPAHHH